MRSQKPIVERNYFILESYDPDSIVVREVKPDELNLGDMNEEDWAAHFEIYVSSYKVGFYEYWRVKFLHMKIYGFTTRGHAVEAGKSLVQAYLQGIYDN